jgi:deoxyribodipyrimidine photo-lyase
MSDKVNIFWFRRDLRLEDNVGLYKALHGKFPVLPVFIFDTDILEDLPKTDARVSFIHQRIIQLNSNLQKNHQAQIATYHGTPEAVFLKLITEFDVQNVITNHDYEPYAIQRDKKISTILAKKGIGFYTFKDQVIFEKDEIVKDNGEPYLVFTPFMKKWKAVFEKKTFKIYASEDHLERLYRGKELPSLSLKDIGFEESIIKVPEYSIEKNLISNYKETRNFPGIKGTSGLSTHLRFGTIGIRQVVNKALESKDQTFLNELIWREFFMQILYHFPETQTRAFKPAYDQIRWRNDKNDFEKWKHGQTGFPLVDAGMRELNQTGLMHNRVRMLVGSFLCKHLLIDWRWGEAYFAEKLLDYEMASNIGNWQWVAGSGVDAAPYFRIFNPETQLDKFDKSRHYTKKWIPELETSSYPKPMLDLKESRIRTLETYKTALENN